MEERIKEAIDNGAFENLPGKGERLDLREELQGLAPEIRMGYRILKNAGYITEETDKNKKDLTVDDLVTTATGKTGKVTAQSKRNFDAFAHKRQLHQNKKFSAYAKKIYQKLFWAE
ncbi:DUF1992 domain-containing protein [Lentibacillus sp. N15]